MKGVPPAESSPAERGRQGHMLGYAFEDKVAELYRLLKYSVEHGRIFAGRQVDILLTGRLGDYQITRIIECKAGPVGAKEIDEFSVKLKLARREYPAANGTIVTGVSFTDAVSAQAAAEGISLVSYRELAGTLVDGHRYCTGLVSEIESNEFYDLPSYVEPRIGAHIDGANEPALEVIERWLSDGSQRQLTLLGDLGTGKSFLMRVVAHRLAKRYLQSPHEAPFPVLIDLREADREVSREGVVVTHFSRNGIEGVSFKVFEHSLAEGNIVLIFDGFDEMASKVTRPIITRNFDELMRCVKGRAKVILTCRTHYFRDRSEEEELLLGSATHENSDSAKALYWDLLGRQGYQIAYLRPFGISEVGAYVRRVRPDSYQAVFSAIEDTYNLLELASRPMLLDMIVKTIDKLSSRKVSATTIYDVFTSIWIKRDQWRQVLTSSEKLAFVVHMAIRFWQAGITSIHHTELRQEIESKFAAHGRDAKDMGEVDHEIRTASFIVRDHLGNYSFAHKSYAEFFLAKHLAAELRSERTELLGVRQLTPEVLWFLSELLVETPIDHFLASRLTANYVSVASENLVLVAYHVARTRKRLTKSVSDAVGRDPISMPADLNLPGADFAQMVLDYCEFECWDLRGADFSRSTLVGAIFRNCNLSGTKFLGADLSGAKFLGVDLGGGSLEGALAHQTHFFKTDLTRVCLTNVDLSSAELNESKLPPSAERGSHLVVDESSRVAEQEGAKLSTAALRVGDLLSTHRPVLLRTLYSRGARDADAEDLLGDLAVRLLAPAQLNDISECDDKAAFLYILRHAYALPRDSGGRYSDVPIAMSEEVVSPVMSNNCEESGYVAVRVDTFGLLYDESSEDPENEDGEPGFFEGDEADASGDPDLAEWQLQERGPKQDEINTIYVVYEYDEQLAVPSPFGHDAEFDWQFEELIHMAEAGLAPEDLVLLRLLLEGFDTEDIRRNLGLSAAQAKHRVHLLHGRLRSLWRSAF